MQRLRLRRPSAALIISFIALMAALGGTSYAAFALPKNSVGTKQLKKSAVTTAKIKNGAVTGSKLNLTGVTVPNASHATSADSATSATSATNATNASNATSVGGLSVKTFSKLVPTNTTTAQSVVTLGGLTLTLACDATGQPTFQATGAVTGSLIRGMKVSVTTTTQEGTSQSTAGTPTTLLAPTDSRGGVAFQYAQPDGHVVSVNAYVDDRVTIGGFDGCSASGSAIGS